MTHKNNVVVVIPVYKNNLDVYESISLEQAHRVLGQYEIRFIAPRGWRATYGGFSDNIKVEYFEARFFQSKHTYSSLMLSPDFYNRFIDFEYMLIYQLDAFVFSDQLTYFCDLGYDYIGAPISRWISIWRPLKKRVGNGGLSLRKVQSWRDLCMRKNEIFQMKPKEWSNNEFVLWEDTFFAFAGSKPEFSFRTPSYVVAENFSVEHDGGKAYKKIRSGWRPFGCHGWGEVDYEFWRPIIEAFGYKLPKGACTNNLSKRMDLLERYAIKRILHYKNFSDYSTLRISQNCVSIWGFGEQGKVCFDFISMTGLGVKYIFDNKVTDGNISVPILRPTDAMLFNNDCPIIVATIKYEAEIIERLEQLGLKINKDYFLWSSLRRNALVQLCGRFMGRLKKNTE